MSSGAIALAAPDTKGNAPAMTTRITQSTVTFQHPVAITGLDQPLPAGTYRLEIEEELVPLLSFPVYRRISAMLDLPSQPGLSQMITIDPHELDAVIARDQAWPTAAKD